MFVDEGKANVIGYLKSTNFQSGLSFGLYNNPLTPGHANTFADLIEAAWPGYARVNVPWANFAILSPLSANIDAAFNFVTLASPAITFLNSDTITWVAWGWFCLTQGGQTMEITAFPTPLAFAPAQSYTFTPRVLDNSLI